MNPRPAGAVAGIGDIELVAITPRPALIHFFGLNVYMPAGKIILNEPGDRTALDKSRQHLDRQAQVAGYTGHIGLGTGGLHNKRVRAVNRLTVNRRNPNPHTCGHEQRVFTVLVKFDSHKQYPFYNNATDVLHIQE